MTKVKEMYFNERRFVGLRTSKAIELNLLVLSDYGFQVYLTTLILKYIKKSENNEF